MRELLCVAIVVLAGYVFACGLDFAGHPKNLSLIQHVIFVIQLKLGFSG